MIENGEQRNLGLRTLDFVGDIVLSPYRLVQERKEAGLEAERSRIIGTGLSLPSAAVIIGTITMGPISGLILGAVNCLGAGGLAKMERNALRANIKSAAQTDQLNREVMDRNDIESGPLF